MKDAYLKFDEKGFHTISFDKNIDKDTMIREVVGGEYEEVADIPYGVRLFYNSEAYIAYLKGEQRHITGYVIKGSDLEEDELNNYEVEEFLFGTLLFVKGEGMEPLSEQDINMLKNPEYLDRTEINQLMIFQKKKN